MFDNHFCWEALSFMSSRYLLLSVFTCLLAALSPTADWAS